MSLVLLVVAILAVAFGFTAFFGAPYVPSRKEELRKAFKNLYPLSKNDLLIDLGSGDGKVLRIATEFGARAAGVELSPILALYSKIRLHKNRAAQVFCRSYFHYDFPAETTVVYVFSDGRDIAHIVRYIEVQAARIGHSIFLISHAFEIEGYKPQKRYRAYYLYKIKEAK